MKPWNCSPKREAQLFYDDPYVAGLQKMCHHDFSELSSQELTESLPRAQDAVVITTGHSGIDDSWVTTHSRSVVDTRNATPAVTSGREKIICA